MMKLLSRLKPSIVTRCKMRRMIRAWPDLFIASLFKFWSDALGGAGAIVAFLTFAFLWRVGTTRSRSMQLDTLAIAINAFIVAGFLWIALAALIALYKAYLKETANGGWHGRRRVFAEPICVGVAVFTEHDNDKWARISFDDAEPNSFIQFRIDLEPEVVGRASCCLEPAPGMLKNLFGSIMRRGPNGAGVPVRPLGNTGGVRLSGRYAYLNVDLLPATVEVTARVYMTSFQIGNG